MTNIRYGGRGGSLSSFGGDILFLGRHFLGIFLLLGCGVGWGVSVFLWWESDFVSGVGGGVFLGVGEGVLFFGGG